MSGLRKLRAALVIALTWGVFWGVVGVVLSSVIPILIGARGPLDNGIRQLANMFFLYGSIGGFMGLAFSAAMAVLGRGGQWQLTRGRALLLGSAGGLGGVLLFSVGAQALLGWNMIAMNVQSVAIFTGIGAITGILTFGTAARGNLPTGRGERKRIGE